MAAPHALIRSRYLSPALFVALVACGDGGGGAATDTTVADVADDTVASADADVAPDADAVVGDTTDASDVPTDVGPTAFDVTVTLGGAPLGDVAVLFHDAQGAVLSESATDASGVASGLVPTGGMVTTVYARGDSERFLVTLTHLDPLAGGAVVDYPAHLAVWGPAALNALTVTAPAFDESSYFTVSNFCDHASGANPAALDALNVFGACVTEAGTQEVLALARTAGFDPTPLAYQLVEGVAGDAATATVESWRTDLSTFTTEVTSVAPFDEQLAVSARVLASPATPAGRDRVSLGESNVSDPLGVRAASFVVPDGLRERVLVHVTARGGGSDGAVDRSSQRTQLVPAVEATLSLHAGGDESDLLPLIDALSGDFTTPARPAIDWSAGFDADWCAGEIAWQPAGLYAQWLLVLPSDATGRAQWPELPASLAALNPDGAMLLPMTCSDWSTIDGYRDYLTHGPVGYFSYGGYLPPRDAIMRVSTASTP